MQFQMHKLANGLTILGEYSPEARSVSVGFFVRTGSRDERSEESGVSHFLEHMAFKGSEQRTAFDINRHFDQIGASNNAQTSEENTIYYASVLPEYVPEVMDVLADLLRPSLRQEDFELEKQVIINEIGQYEDMPDSLAMHHAQRVFFDDHGLGNSILGTPASITALTREQMLDYFRRRYVAPNITLCIAGQFDWPAFVALAEKQCGNWPAVPAPRTGLREAPGSGKIEIIHKEKVVQQYVVLMSAGPPPSSPLRHAGDLLGMVIGDHSASRFYWELVDPGLADSVSYFFHEYEDTGAFYTFLSCEKEEVEENLGIIHHILTDVQENGIGSDELEQARNKLLSRVVRSGERPRGRMFSLGTAWTYYGQYRSIDDELADYEKVKLSDVRTLLDRYRIDRLTTLALGPMRELHVPWANGKG